MIITVSAPEFDTILAALRFWQRKGLCRHTTGQVTCPAHEHEIATNSGERRLLGDVEIDELCERINCDGPREHQEPDDGHSRDQ